MKVKLVKVGNKYAVEKIEDGEPQRLDLVEPIYWWGSDTSWWGNSCLTPHRILARAAIEVARSIYQYEKKRDNLKAAK